MDNDVNAHKDMTNKSAEEDIFSIKPGTLRDMLIRKHDKFLENYRKELTGIKEKKGREVVLKKIVEILPDKTDLLEYWSKNLEENLSRINDDALAQEIREKIMEYRKEKQDAEIEFSAKLDELDEIEKEISRDSVENSGEWLARKIESHEKSLNFWKSYKTEEEKRAEEIKRKESEKKAEEIKRKESEKKADEEKKIMDLKNKLAEEKKVMSKKAKKEKIEDK
ncbi:MAG: hypothetical protein BWK75_01885 [Candidatus Altiarchaeales archaeon A3]|nr:MAG: hypothetical protein BWK75_01885 [Candidatus Altiarchaeales archaeon A3]